MHLRGIRLTTDEKKPERKTKVMVIDACPARAHGIVAALQKEHYEAEEFLDETSIPSDSTADVVVLAFRDAAEVQDVASRVTTACGPHVALVALVPETSAATFRSAFLGGATGAVHQDAHLDRIRECVRLAADGRTVLPADVVHHLVNGRPGTAPAAIASTEAAWLQALADGTTVAQLAAAEAFSEREMHRLLQRLYQRLGVTSRVRALLWALQEGVIR